MIPIDAARTLHQSAKATGSLCVKAWYTADANATVTKGTSTGGAIATESSSISAGSYTINFIVTVTDATLELSHVANASEASSGVNGIAAASLNEGDLIYGVISNGVANHAKCAAVTNCIPKRYPL